MCGPVIAAAIIAVTTTAYQMHTASAERSRQERFRKQREELERRNALQVQALRTEEVHTQQIADADAAALEIEGNRRQAESAMATATTVAGEIGAFGLSYQGLIGEFARQQAEFEGAVSTNLAMKNAVADINKRSFQIDKEAAFINASHLATAKPNYVNYALGGINTYFNVQRGLAGPKAV
jgi:hypothetical protein